MTTQRPPHVERKVVPHLIDKGHVPTVPVLTRADVTTTRATAATAPPHPTVWQPWAVVADRAESEFKAEIATALKALTTRTAAAGKILDTAQGMAAESAGALRAAAWAAFTRYMDSADRTAAAIMDPAYQGYDREVAAATADYDKALADAESTYKAVMSQVNRAKSDNASMTATA